jgi:hypothetical protein
LIGVTGQLQEPTGSPAGLLCPMARGLWVDAAIQSASDRAGCADARGGGVCDADPYMQYVRDFVSEFTRTTFPLPDL